MKDIRCTEANSRHAVGIWRRRRHAVSIWRCRRCIWRCRSKASCQHLEVQEASCWYLEVQSGKKKTIVMILSGPFLVRAFDTKNSVCDSFLKSGHNHGRSRITQCSAVFMHSADQISRSIISLHRRGQEEEQIKVGLGSLCKSQKQFLGQLLCT